MILGAFCHTTRSQLVFIPSKAKVDSAFYVRSVMYPHLVPFWHHCYEQYGWATVIEDGTPGHKGFATCYRNLNQRETTKWPPQSPDLNLIETL